MLVERTPLALVYPLGRSVVIRSKEDAMRTQDSRRVRKQLSNTPLTILVSVLLLVLGVVPALAQPMPSSQVLIPYFEVDLLPEGRDTSFSIVNDDYVELEIALAVHTNWGIQVLESSATLTPKMELRVLLSDWLRSGELPDRTLTAEELAHVQAALIGAPSPVDDLYYSTAMGDGLDLAVGYVRVWVPSSSKADCLFGAYTIIEPASRFRQGETLVNLDRRVDAYPICKRQAILYSECQDTGVSTELMIWTARVGQAQPDPEPAAGDLVPIDVIVYSETGDVIHQQQHSVLPTGKLNACDLYLSEPFGWMDLMAEEEIFVTAHYTENGDYSEAVHGYCLPESLAVPGPGITLLKMVDGTPATFPPGPEIPVGEDVRWTYRVTNSGTVDLHSVDVFDNPPVDVICPETTIEPGEFMVCEAFGIAEPCQFTNVARAQGIDPNGVAVFDADGAYYYGVLDSSIEVEKATQGEDADHPPGPTIQVGETVEWTYEVTNSGSGPLTDVTVIDDRGVSVQCPKSELAAGESMVCNGFAAAEAGPYSNLARARGLDECQDLVRDTDRSHYFGWQPAPNIDLEKHTEGEDADLPPGPYLEGGSEVSWTYQVTNTGEATLQNVTVVDDRVGLPNCPTTILEPGESMLCTAEGIAMSCQYANLATAQGVPMGSDEPVSDSDPSHYFGVPGVDVHIEKATLGVDADVPPGPEILVGDPVTWTYLVHNTGQAPLHGVLVLDDQGVAVSCPATELAAGASMTCTAQGIAQLGQYANLGTALARGPCDTATSDSDPSHYSGRPAEGDQGCSPGYWKNHVGAWAPTSYDPNQMVASVFAGATAYPDLASATLLQALNFGGGTGTLGAAETLLRAAVAGLLNAAHPEVVYPQTTAEIVTAVDLALTSDDRDTMLALATTLDVANNLGCPL